MNGRATPCRWIGPHNPPKLLHSHVKISDAELLAAALLQKLHQMPYLRRWWKLLILNHFPHYPSEPQARIRPARLPQLASAVQALDFVSDDSQPLSVSTFKRAPRCRFRARHGSSTAGPVFGFKLHA